VGAAGVGAGAGAGAPGVHVAADTLGFHVLASGFMMLHYLFKLQMINEMN
jgi:hypothetical protein